MTVLFGQIWSGNTRPRQAWRGGSRHSRRHAFRPLLNCIAFVVLTCCFCLIIRCRKRSHVQRAIYAVVAKYAGTIATSEERSNRKRVYRRLRSTERVLRTRAHHLGGSTLHAMYARLPRSCPVARPCPCARARTAAMQGSRSIVSEPLDGQLLPAVSSPSGLRMNRLTGTRRCRPGECTCTTASPGSTGRHGSTSLSLSARRLD